MSSKKIGLKRLRLIKTPALRTITIEAAILLAIISAFVVEMSHIASSLWLRIFLYNGDSLTLPVIYKSIQLHEPIQWVFSSQLNLFPEAIPFAASLLFGSSVKTILLMNAFFNVLIFYVLIRLFLRVVTRAALRERQLYGLLTMLVLFLCMLLEVPTAFGQTMITYLLFSTYYTGPLFTGILSLCFAAWLIRQKSVSWRGHWKLVLGMIIITSLTIASNPLYVLQFSVPLLVTIGAMGIFGAIRRKTASLLIWQQIIPIALGLLARHLFLASFIGQSSASHLGPLKGLLAWRASFGFAIKSIEPIQASGGTRLRIFISVGLYFGCLFTLLLILNKRQKGRVINLRPERLLALAFIVLEPIVLICALYSANGTPERYLVSSYALALFAIPLLAGTRAVQRAVRPLAYLVTGVAALALILGASKASALQPFRSNSSIGEECLSRALNFKPAYGLADYWIARSLDIYNNYHQRVLQIKKGMVYPWLSNLSDYQGKKFTFYVKQQRGRPFTPLLNRDDNIKVPPGYSSVSVCRDLTVYHYPPGTAGYRSLNARVAWSLNEAEKARSSGSTPKYIDKWGLQN